MVLASGRELTSTEPLTRWRKSATPDERCRVAASGVRPMSRPVHPTLGTALVASGGFGGAALRYGVDLAAPTSLAGTLVVNVLGCLALGLLVALVREGGLLGERTVLVLATGFVSSFTTYSTFVLDAVQSTPEVGAAYVLASYGFGVGATVLGRQAGRLVLAAEGGGG